MELLTKIQDLIEQLNTETISRERKEILFPLIEFIQAKADANQEIRLHFICTHNSRRSLFAQIWAETMAHYFDIKDVCCYSGGTEVTAVYPTLITTFQDSGFQVVRILEGKNPRYHIKYTEGKSPIIGFSKKIDDPFNPKSEFAAIMTCSQADDNCPFIIGAEKRIPLTYEDPKIFDNTEEETKKYKERNLQIATELLYIFSQIRQN